MSQVARLWLVAAVLSGVALVLLPAMSLATVRMPVDVVDDRYDDRNRDGNADEESEEENRNVTAITAGDTVVWEWKGDNPHTVTAHPTSDLQFDSDAECEEQEDNAACRAKGNTFEVRFEEPGTYRYYCKVHADPVTRLTGMVGTIEVEPASEPTEGDDGSEPTEGDDGSEPTSEEDPSEEPESSEPSPSPEPQDDPTSEPTSEGDDQPEGSDQDEASSDGDGPPTRRARRPGFGVENEPRDTADDPGPEVAPEASPGPTFSPFPSAPDLSESETEDMAVTVPSRDGRGPSRGVVIGVAVASLIGSAGAFGKVVLFGQPWT